MDSETHKAYKALLEIQEQEREERAKNAGLVLVLVPLVFLMLLVSSTAYSVLWGWFVVPFGLPPIGVAHMVGIRLGVALVWFKRDPMKREPSAVFRVLWAKVVWLMMTMPAAYAAHWWML